MSAHYNPTQQIAHLSPPPGAHSTKAITGIQSVFLVSKNIRAGSALWDYEIEQAYKNETVKLREG